MVIFSVMDHFFSFGIAYITGGLVFIGIIVTCFTILQDHFTIKNLLKFLAGPLIAENVSMINYIIDNIMN